jgi:hypothetical protein
MRATSVPQALRERLGREASIGLIEYVDAEQSEWSDRVLNIAVERFERRLAEQMGELRTALVREIQETRTETIRWTFVFWTTQLTAFVGLLVFIFRNSPR